MYSKCSSCFPEHAYDFEMQDKVNCSSPACQLLPCNEPDCKQKDCAQHGGGLGGVFEFGIDGFNNCCMSGAYTMRANLYAALTSASVCCSSSTYRAASSTASPARPCLDCAADLSGEPDWKKRCMNCWREGEKKR